MASWALVFIANRFSWIYTSHNVPLPTGVSWDGCPVVALDLDGRMYSVDATTHLYCAKDMKREARAWIRCLDCSSILY